MAVETLASAHAGIVGEAAGTRRSPIVHLTCGSPMMSAKGGRLVLVRHVALSLIAATPLLFTAACGSYSAAKSASTGTPQSAATAPAANPTSDGVPDHQHTGIAAVDAAIDAVAAGDGGALAGQVQYTQTPCNIGPGGAISPPQCPAGTVPGDLMTILPVDRCGVSNVPPAGAADAFTDFLSGGDALYGVYVSTPLAASAPARYTILFAANQHPHVVVAPGQQDAARELIVSDAGITRVWYSCPPAFPDDIAQSLGDSLIPPPPLPLATGPGGIAYGTGIASIDQAIDAMAAHNEIALDRQMRLTKKPCAAHPTGQSSQTTCRGSEHDGDLVDVFPTATCEPYDARPEVAQKSLHEFFDNAAQLVSAYRWPADQDAPLATYALLYELRAGDSASGFSVGSDILLLDDDGIVGQFGGCARTPRQLIAAGVFGDAIPSKPASATPTSETPKPVPTNAESSDVPHTGITVVDDAIGAVMRHDEAALLALVRYEKLPCITHPQGLDADPVCRDREREGMLVDVLATAHCEVFPARPDQVPAALSDLFDARVGNLAFYGAYRELKQTNLTDVPVEYVVMFSIAAGDGQTYAFMLHLNRDGVVAAGNACSGSPEGVVSSGGLTEIPARE
jgi:hypothetical protein